LRRKKKRRKRSKRRRRIDDKKEEEQMKGNETKEKINKEEKEEIESVAKSKTNRGWRIGQSDCGQDAQGSIPVRAKSIVFSARL
jgi:hypothetical protein